MSQSVAGRQDAAKTVSVVDPPAMEVDAFLADDAETAGGKIYALGIGWNTLHASTFPIVHPRMTLALVVSVPYTETNEPHRLSVHLEDADGSRVRIDPGGAGRGSEEGAVLELSVDLNVGRPAQLAAGDEQLVPIAMRMDGLYFERPNRYVWVISVDGQEMKRLPLRVAQAGRPGPHVA